MNREWHVIIRVPGRNVKLEQVIEAVRRLMPQEIEPVEYVQESSIHPPKTVRGDIDWTRAYVGGTQGVRNKVNRDVLKL